MKKLYQNFTQTEKKVYKKRNLISLINALTFRSPGITTIRDLRHICMHQHTLEPSNKKIDCQHLAPLEETFTETGELQGNASFESSIFTTANK